MGKTARYPSPFPCAFAGGTCLARPPQSWLSTDSCTVPGEPVSAALLWLIRPEDNGTWSWRKRWPPANAGQKDELLDHFFSGMATQHDRVMGKDPHVCTLDQAFLALGNISRVCSHPTGGTANTDQAQDFELIMTDPAHQRQGHALALLQRASEIADGLGYPAYLDAEKYITHLYSRAGYVANSSVEQTSVMVPMVRPAKSR